MRDRTGQDTKNLKITSGIRMQMSNLLLLALHDCQELLCCGPAMQHNPWTATKMFQIGDQDQRSEGFRIETIICMSMDYFWHTNNQAINLLGK